MIHVQHPYNLHQDMSINLNMIIYKLLTSVAYRTSNAHKSHNLSLFPHPDKDVGTSHVCIYLLPMSEYVSMIHICFFFYFSFTSRKHGQKEPQSVSHCGSFDHRNLQSLNDCKKKNWVLRLQF